MNISQNLHYTLQYSIITITRLTAEKDQRTDDYFLSNIRATLIQLRNRPPLDDITKTDSGHIRDDILDISHLRIETKREDDSEILVQG